MSGRHKLIVKRKFTLKYDTKVQSRIESDYSTILPGFRWNERRWSEMVGEVRSKDGGKIFCGPFRSAARAVCGSPLDTRQHHGAPAKSFLGLCGCQSF
jgi:hypothetical protein